MVRGVQSVVVLAAVFLTGVVAWSFDARPELVAQTASLAEIPNELAGYVGSDLPIDGQVESMLRADWQVQRAYEHPLRGLVWLYVGYYGTTRGGTPEHTPRVCYAAHDWQLLRERELQVAPAPSFAVQEYLLDHDGERRLVHYYYRSHRSTGMLGLARLRIDHFLGNLLDGRADGALIRLSAPVGSDDEERVRSRLLAFAAALEPELEAAWPSEAPQGTASGL